MQNPIGWMTWSALPPDRATFASHKFTLVDALERMCFALPQPDRLTEQTILTGAAGRAILESLPQMYSNLEVLVADPVIGGLFLGKLRRRPTYLAPDMDEDELRLVGKSGAWVGLRINDYPPEQLVLNLPGQP